MRDRKPHQTLLVLLSVHLTLLQGAAAVETVWVDRLPPFHSDDILLPLNLCGQCDQFDALASEDRCLCYCDLPNKNSFYEPFGKCAENKQVRDMAGCSLYFDGEHPDSPLHLFDPSIFVNDKPLKIPSGKECRVNQEGAGNEYLKCDGIWKRMWTDPIQKKFGSRTVSPNTEWSDIYALRVKQDQTGSTAYLDGRIIKLDMECRPKDGIKTPVDNNCLLFKIKGRVRCPLQNISRPIHSPDITKNAPLTAGPQISPSYVSPTTLTAASLAPSTTMTSVVTSLSSNSTTTIRTTGPPVKTGNRNSPQGNSARIGIIVGAAVGGCVVLIVFILVLIKVCCARKSRQRGRQHRFHAQSPGPVFQNPLSTFPVYTDAANSRTATPTEEKTASMANPSYMKAADGTVIPCALIYSDQSPNGPPPRPPNNRIGSGSGDNAHSNEGFISENDHVTMNPLYESSRKQVADRRDLERRSFSQDSLAYDIPEEILDELRRTANSYSPPEYQATQKPQGDANHPKTSTPRRGHFYDVPETKTEEQIYVKPEREIYDDVVENRDNASKPDVNTNPGLHVTSPGRTDTKIQVQKPFSYTCEKSGAEKPRHFSAQAPRLTVASVGSTSPLTEVTVSPSRAAKKPPVARNSSTSGGSGSPKPAIKIKKPVQKSQMNASATNGGGDSAKQLYDDVIAAMSTSAFRA